MKIRPTALLLLLCLLGLGLAALPLAAESPKTAAAPPELFQDLWQQVGGQQAAPLPQINICTICLAAYNNCLARCGSNPTCQGQCSAQLSQCTPCDCSGGVPHG